MKYYAITGQGPWQEIVVTREPRSDGRTDLGMQVVSQEPTGVSYNTFRAAAKAIEVKNRALAGK